MPRTKKTSAEAVREVLYPKISLKLCQGDTALTVAQAKKLLGWVELPDDAKEYQFRDRNKKKVRCENNPSNRPLGTANVDTLIQEHLRRRWRLNCENIIIGQTGLILNGQHRLIAFVLASQLVENDPDWYRDEYDIEGPLTMETTIGFGVSEADDVVNTMDTCKPRSLADVIYRAGYFESYSAVQRKKISKALDYAVRLLWHRTGFSLEAYSIKRTHAESIDFINRHPSLVKHVKHIFEENGSDNNVGLLISLGTAAGLSYLMACSESLSKPYRDSGYLEDSVEFSLEEKAEEFWTLVAQGSDFDVLRKSMARLIDDGDGSLQSRCSMVVTAWNLWREGKKLTQAALTPAYVTDPDTGIRKLAQIPTVGGIDLGEPTKADLEVEPKKPKQARKRQKPAPKTENAIAEGSVVYVLDGETPSDYWVGELVGLSDGMATVISDEDGEPYGEIPIESVRIECPE